MFPNKKFCKTPKSEENSRNVYRERGGGMSPKSSEYLIASEEQKLGKRKIGV